MKLFIYFVLLCHHIFQEVQANQQEKDPCLRENHVIIVELYTRSLGYIRPAHNDPLCDDFIPEIWHRFTGRQGGDMTTRPPPPESCGTTFPIWLNGKLPTDTKTHKMEACVRTFNNTCAVKYDVLIRNCGDYNVYKPARTRGCAQAYCIGTEVPCPDGESSENGWTPGCRKGKFPTLPENPVIRTGFIAEGNIRGSKRQIEMTCNVQHPNEPDVVYEVYWYIDDQLVHQQIENEAIAKENMPARIREDQGLKVGTYLKCQLLPKYRYSTVVGYGKSTTYYMGFQVTSQVLTVYEGGNDAVYEIRPTVPILCLVGFENGCELSIKVQKPVNDNKPAVCSNGVNIDQVAFKFESTRCAINIPMTINTNQKFSLNVGAALDGIYDADHVVEISLKTDEVHFHHTFWQNYVLPTAQVYVIDRDVSINGKSCKAYNDPHMKTFDGRHYEHHFQGEFMLYRHITLPIQVHGYFKKCPKSKGTCICGAAVRSGGDLFVYDHCREKKPYRLKMYACRTGSLKVEELAPVHYKVHLPTGGKVELMINSITIYPSLSDIGKTEGLCGTFDGKCENDFKLQHGTYNPNNGGSCGESLKFYPKAFSMSWRVKTEHSLYKGNFRDDYIPEKIVYCSCKEDIATGEPETLCGDMGEAAVQYCINRAHTDRHTGRCLHRIKRNVDSDDDIEDEVEMFTYDSTFEPSKPTWNNGWTENKAREECVNYIENRPSTKACMLEGVGDVSAAIESCMADIQITGNTTYNIVHLEGVLSECTIEISKNMSYYSFEPSSSVNSDNTTVYELKTPAMILHNICPSDCNDNGICVNGSCVCHRDFTGSDCSEEKNKIPKLFDLPSGGKCDIQKRPCLMTPVTGDYFIESDKLVCKVQAIKILKSGTHEAFSTYYIKPEFDHFQRVLCAINKRQYADNVLTYGYHVSISNDGNQYSEPKTVTVFDSQCMNCAKDLDCTLKEDFCFISNKCYMQDEINSENLCQKCDSSMSTSEWTQVKSPKCNGSNVTTVSQYVLLVIVLYSARLFILNIPK